MSVDRAGVARCVLVRHGFASWGEVRSGMAGVVRRSTVSFGKLRFVKVSLDKKTFI